jgi:hypothetical protein
MGAKKAKMAWLYIRAVMPMAPRIIPPRRMRICCVRVKEKKSAWARRPRARAFWKRRAGRDSGCVEGVRWREYGREDRRRVAEEEFDVRG